MGSGPGDAGGGSAPARGWAEGPTLGVEFGAEGAGAELRRTSDGRVTIKRGIATDQLVAAARYTHSRMETVDEDDVVCCVEPVKSQLEAGPTTPLSPWWVIQPIQTPVLAPVWGASPILVLFCIQSGSLR